jgi:tetratricopeptide (TPR) repeat protein
MKFKGVALLVASILTVGASYGIRAATDRPAARAADVAGLDRTPSGLDVAELARLIRAYETRVAARPDALDFGFLSGLYVERARVTGDVASYLQADAAATAALRLAPADAETQRRLASIKLSTHDFGGALAIARRAPPDDISALGVSFDAELELGNVERAKDIAGRLAVLAPDTAAVDVRLARLAFLTGDPAGARRRAEAAERHAVSEGAFGPTLAFYRVFRAHLEFDTGRYDVAAEHAEAAVRAQPGYHVALATLARVRAAQGRTAETIRLYQQASEIVPQPEYLSALGDLLAIRGDARAAEERYSTIGVIGRVNRLLYNRSIALFLADHGREAAEAVRLTSAELRVRPDVYGWDAYAWTLHAGGRDAEARTASDRALALGTRDAKLWYHAGMISLALGDHARARTELSRALAISPAFDPLQAPRAREALASIGATD